MDKAVLTLDRILDRYFYKEWVQQELRDVGETVSGEKPQLIRRFLNSERMRRKPVDEIGASLLSTLRLAELKQIAADLGIETQGNRNQLLRRIRDSVVFEPYVRRTNRHCDVCLKETRHELHFGVDWRADRFVCEVCKIESPAQAKRGESQGGQLIVQPIIDLQWTESTLIPEKAQAVANSVVPLAEQPATESVAKPERMSGHNGRDTVSHQALAWAIALGLLCVFLAVSIPFGLAYGWLWGITGGLAAAILAGLILIPTRHRWTKVLLKMVK